MTASLGLVVLLTTPPGGDLPAQIYRANLFAHGFLLWDGSWYAGHYLPSYSVLTPALATLFGPRLLALAAATAASATFAAIINRRFDHPARVAVFTFATAVLADVVVGRTAFALGQALGLAAILALVCNRPRVAVATALLSALASPVAGLLLSLVVAAAFLHAPTRRLLAVIAGGALPVAALAIAFPDGGVQPFRTASFAAICAVAAAAYALLPRSERVLRTAVALYALTCLAAYALPTPLGSNVLRLGTLFVGPLLLAVLPGRRRTVLIAAAVLPMVAWQAMPAINSMARANDDPSLSHAYYTPLLRYLHAHRRAAMRIEIPPTLNHWESAYVAPRAAIARGWERQLDVRFNPIFYDRTLGSARYHRWLAENAVSFVALPDARPDFSSEAEVSLIKRRPPYLRLAWSGRHWKVFRVLGTTPLADDGASVRALYPAGFDVTLGRTPATTVKVRYSSLLTSRRACVTRTRNGWTHILARPHVRVDVHAEWAIDRDSGCSPTAAPPTR